MVHFHANSHESLGIPPFLLRNDLWVLSLVNNLCVRIEDYFGIIYGCQPKFTFIVSEVNLISTLTFEVDIEPFGELTRENDQICQPVNVERCKNDYRNFII